jgi:hypothetical protein
LFSVWGVSTVSALAGWYDVRLTRHHPRCAHAARAMTSHFKVSANNRVWAAPRPRHAVDLTVSMHARDEVIDVA